MSQPQAIIVGHFDGVHLGHAALVAAARAAVGAGGRVVCLSFEPHPLSVLRPDAVPASLSSLDQRRGWLMEAGADEVVPLAPDPERLAQSAEAFLEWLVGEHRPDVIVEGPDFRFGRDRTGSVETLRRLEPVHGYRTIVIDEVETPLANHAVVRVRSSLIRWLVCHGRVRDAGMLLGRPYEIRGRVARGDGRGGPDLGVPTANLDCGGALLPADGIYVGLGEAPDGRRYPAAVSVGTKPTFGERPRVCEAHLAGYAGPADHYGWALRLEVHDWLRDQIAYNGVRPLIEQIERDIEQVKALAVGAES